MGVMTLLQLKYIVKIVECGSMNEASHELYVSQPALSSSVKELENELGIEIFTRSSQGIALTVDGAEFLTYARQVLDQASLLEERYKNAKPRKQLCSVSTQHYMFAVEAFVEMIDSTKSDEYEFTIRETRTKDIINQVANMLSEIGIIYLSDFNKDVIGKLLREKHLEFHPLFRAPLHVFISRDNPLAGKKKVTMDDLKPFPFIQYEQGEEGSFFFAEEAVWPEYSPKQINVTDRATILNFIIGLVLSVDRMEKTKDSDTSAVKAVEAEFGFPVFAIANVKEIFEAGQHIQNADGTPYVTPEIKAAADAYLEQYGA